MDSRTTSPEDERVGRRSGGDRRTREEPIAHDDRRKAERRTGEDRRTEARR